MLEDLKLHDEPLDLSSKTMKMSFVDARRDKLEQAVSRLEQQRKNNNNNKKVPSSSSGLLQQLRSFSKQSMRQKQLGISGRAPLADNFTSPAKGWTQTCVSPNQHGMCRLGPCSFTNSSSNTTNTYSGFVLRNNSIRGTIMTVSGSAAAGSGCAMSQKYRFIYIHVLKSAGMTFKAFLKRALCNNTTKMPCSNGNRQLQIVDCARALQTHPDYFVWSFVRNPYSRFYSAYSMALAFRQNRDSKQIIGKPRKVPFAFDDFALQRSTRRQMSHVSPAHYYPQTDFLFARQSDCPVFDFLGRLEHLQEDFNLVLKRINSPELFQARDTILRREASTAFGSRQGTNSLQQAYHDSKVVQAVRDEFERDFRLLGYDPDIVPQ